MFKQIINLFRLSNLWPKQKGLNANGILLALWILVVYTVFSGAIRKWILGSGALGSIVLLLQLILPVFFYWRIYKNPLPKQSLVPFFWLVYLFYILLIALNPMNHTLYHGIFGLVLHTGFWLIWLAYLQKGQWMEIERLVPLLIVIMLVEFVLATLQYSLPETHILNIQASGDVSNAIVGDAVRVSGTFSYIGGFQVMLPLFACLAWFMMLRRYAMGLVLIVLGFGLVMAFMSGSRGAVGFFILYSAMAFLLSGNIGGRIFRSIVQGGIILMLLIWLVPSAQNLVFKSYDNFVDRVENSDEMDERVIGSFDEVLNFRGQYSIFGIGLGATYQGTNALFGTSIYVLEYGGYESEPARIILEGGYVLFFLRLILILVFLKQTPNLPLIAKGFLFVVFYNSMMTFNIYQGIFYVLGVILIDRGYYLKQQEILQSNINKNLNK